MVSHDNDLYLEFYVILLLSAGLESKGANIERGFESGRTSCRR
jgi:hypothetical protein